MHSFYRAPFINEEEITTNLHTLIMNYIYLLSKVAVSSITGFKSYITTKVKSINKDLSLHFQYRVRSLSYSVF